MPTTDTESRLAPREATEEMARAGAARFRDFFSEGGPYPRAKAVYRAMIAAAPPVGEDARKRAAHAVSEIRAAEVGGCFRPDDADQIGECADGDCYCSRQCRETVDAVLAAILDSLGGTA